MSWNDFTERYTSGSRISPAVTLSTQDVIAVSSSIAWNALTPTGTTVTIEIAVSTDNGTTWGDWQVCTNGSAVPGISELGNLANVQLKIRETLTTNNVHATPELQDLTIDIVTAWRNIVYGPNKSTLTAWDSISLAWKSDRLSLVVNDSEAAHIENPGLPAALGSDLFIGTDRNGSNAINTLVDELRIDKVYREVATRAAWHKMGVPFYTSEDMKQWPGYLKAETDGLKVYDAENALRVLIGSWIKDAVRKYGIKIIGGEFYAGYMKTAEEDETDYYVEIGQTSNRGFMNFIGVNNKRSLRLHTDGSQGTIIWYNSAGEQIAKIFPNGGTVEEMLFSSDTGLTMSSWTGESIKMGPNDANTSARGIQITRINSDVTPYADDAWNLGASTRRWADAYIRYVHTGDLCFAEKSCPLCGGDFKPGDVLSLLVQHIDDSTYTIPIHERCKDLQAEFEVEIPERETKYRLNERGETEAYLDVAYEESEEEIITVHPDYVFEERSGNFLRRNNEENAQYFDHEYLKKGIAASRETALVTDTVKRRKPKYKKRILKVN